MKPVASISPQTMALLVAAVSVASALGSGFVWRDPRNAMPSPIPASTGVDAGRGRKLLVQSCAHCHGDDARGNGEDGDGPDLAGLAIGNARIAAVITHGIPEEMPSFAKKHGAADIADLTAFLRTLR